MKKSLAILVLLLNASLCWAQFLLQSPDEKIRVTLHSEKKYDSDKKSRLPEKATMRVFSEKSVILYKEIGLTVKAKGERHTFGKMSFTNVRKGFGNTNAPLSEFKGKYNDIRLNTAEGVSLEVRAYNDGVAFRFHVAGYGDEYKILEVCDVLPDEDPVAILGTFSGDIAMPWRILKIETDDKDISLESIINDKVNTTTKSELTGRGTRIVPWKDALSSITVGSGINWYNGNAWGDISQEHNITADFTYKYLYFGASHTPCHEVQYIHWDGNFWPFGRVMGSVHAWSLGAKAGFCLPVQNGYEVWSFIPYVAASVMHLRQHGKIHPTYTTVSPHNYYMVGPGVKVQCAFRNGISLGASYEYQVFTAKNAPYAMNSFSMSIGKMF